MDFNCKTFAQILKGATSVVNYSFRSFVLVDWVHPVQLIEGVDLSLVLPLSPEVSCKLRRQRCVEFWFVLSVLLSLFVEFYWAAFDLDTSIWNNEHVECMDEWQSKIFLGFLSLGGKE